MSKVRLSLDVSPELYEVLTKLSWEMGETKAGVLRKSIALFEVWVKAHRRGESLAIINADGSIDTRIVGL